ncbi:hypothetical protein F2Q69_00059415 [Brassica cretica]|uniref:Uncharacterized protein n=1 Tax=Brassica cretica TaxID=69181 RepID=A0A8S9RER3_BRACR|nr:hypothetical protein F2Q69_00059415 [Brassica cretica]
MELAIPPDLLVVPGGESWEKTAEDGRVPIEKKLDQINESKEEVGDRETCNEGREEMVGESSTHTEEVAESNKRLEDVEKWFQVSPRKTGRQMTPGKNETEIQISASKFTVLSINEEEEGAIVEEAQDFEIYDMELEEINTLQRRFQALRTLHFGEKKNKAILSATATRGLATMELAIPPDLLVVPGGESWEKTAEDGRVPI